MPRSAEDVLREMVGNLMFQVANLTAQVEALTEQLAATRVSAAPDKKPTCVGVSAAEK
jgi:hypothetical protein